MQIKRNPMGQLPINQLKQTHLMQPFLNISKASTPVRTRLVANGQQVNNTPISINKIVGNIHKSPNNKENMQGNRHKVEGNTKVYGTHLEGQNRINLSPVLALNRKLNQGPKFNVKRALTPEGPKVNDDYEGYGNDKKGQFQKQFSTLSSIHDSKGNTNFSSTTNLRGSNCFKALIQNRNKSPNKLEGSSGGKMMQKRQSTPLLKQSLSSNRLFKTMGLQSKARLSESRSSDQLKVISNNRLESSDIRCMNNDGKKAKYRVQNNEQNKANSPQTQLYFCSKCTIPLVQQGFIVEQLGRQIPREHYQHPDSAVYAQYRNKLEEMRKQTECVLIEIGEKEQDELSRLDQYYTIIFDYLERQRKSDKRKIEEYYQSKKQEPASYVRDICVYIEGIQDIVSNPTAKSFRQGQLQQFVDNQEILSSKDIGLFEENVQNLADKFLRGYEQHFKIQMGQPKGLSMLQSRGANDSVNNRNHPMRFSFQKLISSNNNKRINKDTMNPLMEVDEEQQQNEGNEPQKHEPNAFRDLFPEQDGLEQLNSDLYSPTFKKI